MPTKLSLRARLFRYFLFGRKHQQALLKGRINAQRRSLNNTGKLFPRHKNVTVKVRDVAGVQCEWHQPNLSARGTLLYIHGGGYIIGSAAAYRGLISRLALATELETVAPDYALAPEAPFPAGLDDCIKVYKALLEDRAVETLYLAGDSAGGGLSLALLLRLKEEQLPLPQKVYLLSPLTDQTGTSESFTAREARDPVLSCDWLINECRSVYVGHHKPDAPLISPLFGDLNGLPPLFIQVGSEEILFDDSNRLAEKARQAGVPVELEIAEGLWHDWPLMAPWLPEANAAIQSVGRFFKA